MLPHRIRLRGPWQLIPLSRTGGPHADLPPPVVAMMPARWSDCGLGDFAGRVRHLRRFGSPRSLDSFERVWLTLDGVAGQCEIQFNDERLGQWPENSPPIEIDVTQRLRERNELQIDIESPGPGGGMTGEVALEIRGQAWLADVAATMAGGRLTIRGIVKGQADAPLDLYAIMGRFTVIQKRIEASPQGRPFEFTSEPLQAGSAVRIELVQGSNILHAVETPPANEE